ncbi:MAG: DUF3043 domain-containing protein [Nocardioides sp.]
MFRRTKSADPGTESAAETPAPSGKGRPTPSRKEAEAAAKARAKVPRTRKEIAAQQKLGRRESSAAMRQAMRTGDDRALPQRDRGPVRRFVRDFVDSRFSLIELFIPIMLVVLVLGYSGNETLRAAANTGMFAVLLLIVVDMVRLRFKVRREVERRFPDTTPQGLTYYAITRAMQMRFMRMPKSQVKVGQSLPERYR